MPAADDSFPLSALQHFAFCPRQCALVHVERLWEENTLTAEGRVLHDRTHDAGSESRGDLRIARALSLQSTTLGLHGVADVVEFHRQCDGTWRPFPVEYKRGRPKHAPIDAVQLCAQAICSLTSSPSATCDRPVARPRGRARIETTRRRSEDARFAVARPRGRAD